MCYRSLKVSHQEKDMADTANEPVSYFQKMFTMTNTNKDLVLKIHKGPCSPGKRMANRLKQ